MTRQLGWGLCGCVLVLCSLFRELGKKAARLAKGQGELAIHCAASMLLVCLAC